MTWTLDDLLIAVWTARLNNFFTASEFLIPNSVSEFPFASVVNNTHLIVTYLDVSLIEGYPATNAFVCTPKVISTGVCKSVSLATGVSVPVPTANKLGTV